MTFCPTIFFKSLLTLSSLRTTPKVNPHKAETSRTLSWLNLWRLTLPTVFDTVVSSNRRLDDPFIHKVAVDIDSMADSVSGLLKVTSDDLAREKMRIKKQDKSAPWFHFSTSELKQCSLYLKKISTQQKQPYFILLGKVVLDCTRRPCEEVRTIQC